MRLLEKDAKQLLQSLGIPTPKGFFIDWSIEQWPVDRVWEGPYYLKAQVLAGRRGKSGLVRKCVSQEEFTSILAELRAQLSPEVCAGFWCEQEQPHSEEWFVACDIDRVTGHIRGHVSQEGGKEVAVIHSLVLDASTQEDQTKLETLPVGIQTLLKTLAEALPKLDALSIEINPCVLGQDSQAIALDGKIELDDAASFRHPEWESFADLSRFGAVSSAREQAYINILLTYQRPILGAYVELTGNIAMILAGGGASLLAMDALKKAGGQPANYLELSGNPDPEFLKQAASIVFSHPDIRAIWIAGSFANFTDISATVSAILEAIAESGLRVPIFIRRDGPNADLAEQAASQWSMAHNLPVLFQRGTVDLSESAQAVVSSLTSSVV